MSFFGKIKRGLGLEPKPIKTFLSPGDIIFPGDMAIPRGSGSIVVTDCAWMVLSCDKNYAFWMYDLGRRTIFWHLLFPDEMTGMDVYRNGEQIQVAVAPYRYPTFDAG